MFCANPLRLLDDRLYLFPDPGPVFLFFFRVGLLLVSISIRGVRLGLGGVHGFPLSRE